MSMTTTSDLAATARPQIDEPAPAFSDGRATKAGQSLVSADLFSRLAARIRTEHPNLPADMPDRIVDQALAFLGTCATATRPIGPSELVDIGWHAFILYTVEYRQFCEEIAGRFIEHMPDDQPDDRPAKPVPPSLPVTLADTVAAIRDAGYALDADLWHGEGAECSKCSQCHAGCSDSPR